MILQRSPLVVWPVETPARRDQAEPITIGVPLPRGRVGGAVRLALVDEAGRAVPLQARTTESWPDGSARWILARFQAIGPAADRRYELQLRDEPEPALPAPAVMLTEHGNGVVVDTGAARFEMATGTGFPFDAVVVRDRRPIRAAAFVVTDAKGASHPARTIRIAVEERGPVSSTVRLEAVVGPARSPLVEVVARVELFAGSAAARVSITVRNPRRARHKGGFWELGDAGSVYLRDATVRLDLPAAATGIACSPEPGAPLESFRVPFELYQDSSGGENWSSIVHVNRDGLVPCVFRGYRIVSGANRRLGLRATPAVVAQHDGGAIALSVEDFWQNFPKAIEIDGDALRFRLLPRQFADLHELQGGEQKTHRFTLAFGDDPLARDAAFWGRTPAVAAMTPEWYAAAEAVRWLSPAADDRDDRYRRLVAAAVEPPTGFAERREVVDEYGWRHFGDLYADHENAFSRDPNPIVSHYNNQYDAIGGFACQFMRTADARWWRLMNELAAHVVDIDIYHTDRDKAAFNGGLFWHTYHYVSAGRSTHRSYPRRAGVWGGGPANEHNYSSGLRLHWLITGNVQSRDAAVGLARWVIDMDDGRKTVFRWLSRARTGLASATQSPAFHGPGRGAAYSILALIDGHRLTDERRFLTKAEELLARCVHPADDVERLNLLDAERRWSYVVFLQAVGKYLDYKRELGEIDAAFAYARGSLLRYVRWMAANEYPYLDKPEILEFPTETWAAQDMRKAEVFWFAAAHAPAADRDRFVGRAHFFFDYSVSTLMQSATRALARPLVLLLSNGFMHLAPDSAKLDREPAPSSAPIDVGAPARFRYQKAIVKQRLKTAAAVAAAAGIILAVAAFAMR